MKLQELITKAKSAYENKEIEEALDLYLEAEKIAFSSELLIEIALIYDELGNYDKAIEYYEKVLAIDIDNPICYYGLGTIYDNLNLYDEAIGYYKEAIRIDEKYVEAHFFLANIYDEIKEMSLAIYHYQKVIEYNPDHFYGYLNLGSIYESMNQNETALSLFKIAESINEDNHLLYFNFGVVYRKLNQIDLSIDSYYRSLEISKKYPFTFLNLAIIYKDDLKDLNKAIEVYTEGIKHHPGSAVLYYNRACCLAILKNDIEAVKDLERAFKLDHSLIEYAKSDEELVGLSLNYQ